MNRLYIPGYYCDHCTSPGECDFGGCAYENDEVEALEIRPAYPESTFSQTEPCEAV